MQTKAFMLLEKLGWGFGCVATVMAAAFTMGCAEERPPINRVQPDALAKSFFVGPDLTSITDDPEFYRRGTVVDVSYGGGQGGLFTSSWAQPVSRVRWEITEDTLNARLSYERISGTDGKGTQYNGVQVTHPKAANDGQIVASYRIAEHFDIQRQYNEQTGEELNVVVENTTDRPWNARSYFRVDWSTNLITSAYDYDTLAMLGVLGGVKYDSLAYTVLDPKNPDAPHFEADQGYFDVTNKVYATALDIDLGGGDKLPACFFPAAIVQGATYPSGNCNPTELTIRESYRKVVDHDYEPMDFDGIRFQILGGFNDDFRRGYARNYGMLDREWNRFLGRYNIWDRSHYYQDPAKMVGDIKCATKETTEDPTGDPNSDPNRDTDKNGTADECQGDGSAAHPGAGSGARCDIFTQKCTLPYRDRTLKTIPWYVAGDTSLFEPTNQAVLEWDLAMKTAVQVSRLVECRKTGGTDCDTQFPMWNGQQDDNDEAVRMAREMDVCRRDPTRGWASADCAAQADKASQDLFNERGAADPGTLAIGKVVSLPPIIVLCHNPVEAGDHPECGKPDLVVRPGDLRYNVVNNVPAPQSGSPWGIMVDANDPLTGEKVAGSMNIWTAVTDMAAQQLVDQVRFINGEISADDITNGTYVRDWAAAAKLGGAGKNQPLLSSADITKRLAGATNLDSKAFAAATLTPPGPALRDAMDGFKGRAFDIQTRNDVASPGMAKVDAIMKLGRGTAMEAQLINAPTLQVAGAPPGASLTGNMADLLSPLALNNPLARTRLRETRQNALAARGACIIDEAPEPTSMPGMADALAQKFPIVAGETSGQRQARYDRMVDYVRRKYHYAVIAHEMGHSIGLRHNFVSSSAPLFYRPQYWQLRTNNARTLEPCTGPTTDGSSCVGPRYWDPVTGQEQSQLLSMWMQSTVMDYPGDTSQDMIGLGATDFASARFFYGDNVSVYKADEYKAGTPIGVGIARGTDTFGGFFGIRYGQVATDPLNPRAGQAYKEFHYSQLQANYGVIKDCYQSHAGPPANWNASVSGEWNALLDGGVVSVDSTSGNVNTQGVFTKCRQQPVDYVGYTQLRYPNATETFQGPFYGGPDVDPAQRLRVPYAFATDYWADGGNISVMRHDNGADPYEQVSFLITTQEDRHIFDNYRRGRSTFSIVGAVDRSFERYNIKLQGISTGIAFYESIYRDWAIASGMSFDDVWPFVVTDLQDNMIAATMAFDHFTRELARPQPGWHYRRLPQFADPVLHSDSDADDLGLNRDCNDPGQAPVIVPNGATGYFKDVGFGGHLLENSLARSNGDFYVEYFDNAGSYYDKINTALLLALSEDRFVSASRRDFYDARFRAVGMADIFPDGFRRIIANALTNDRSILASRVVADAAGNPMLDTTASTMADPAAQWYPARPIGWPSFWPKEGPQHCFATDGRDLCESFLGDLSFAPDVPANSVAIDPQIGWEAQKFLIAWTAALIKANEKTTWMDMMRIWKLGQNTAPDISPRIEWQDPQSGDTYIARDLGTECLFGDPAKNCAGGQVVQKGIAARVLEYANQLTAKGYQLDTATYPGCAAGAAGCNTPTPAGFNEFGRAMVARHPDGTPVVRADPAIGDLLQNSKTNCYLIQSTTVDCNRSTDPTCTPLTLSQNHFAYELVSYKSVPDYLWEAETVYGWFGPPGARGVY